MEINITTFFEIGENPTAPFDPTPEEWAKLHADPKYGPRYPDLSAAVAKWRRVSLGRDLTPDETRAYGQAVRKAFRALNTIRPYGDLDLRCTAWEPNPKVKWLAKAADEAIEKRIGAEAFRAWKARLKQEADACLVRRRPTRATLP